MQNAKCKSKNGRKRASISKAEIAAVEPDTAYAGICRVCGCTHDDPCPEGCGWADRTHTLCDACQALTVEQQVAVRRERLADLLQARDEAWLAAMASAPIQNPKSKIQNP